MEVIAVANNKGGSGKTTTAVNLAADLALLGKRTLLIDMDPQAAATSGVGIDEWTLEKTIYDALKNVSLQEVIIPTTIEGLYIAPANLYLSVAEVELASQLGRELILGKKVRKLNKYDYAIIDTPPYFGILTMNALVACSTLLVPIQAEYYAMRGMTQLLQVVNMVEERMEVSIKRRYLLTMYDSRTKLSRDVVEQVREHLKEAVFKTAIPRNVRLAESPSSGKPIGIYDPDSAGAIAYRQLAEEVIEWLAA